MACRRQAIQFGLPLVLLDCSYRSGYRQLRHESDPLDLQRFPLSSACLDAVQEFWWHQILSPQRRRSFTWDFFGPHEVTIHIPIPQMDQCVPTVVAMLASGRPDRPVSRDAGALAQGPFGHYDDGPWFTAREDRS